MGKSGCDCKRNKIKGKEKKRKSYKPSRPVLLFFVRANCYYRIYLQNFISGALMLVRNVKLKVSLKKFWLHGFMWLPLIRAVKILQLTISASIQHDFLSSCCFSYCLLPHCYLSGAPSLSVSLFLSITVFHSLPPVLRVHLSAPYKHTHAAPL